MWSRAEHRACTDSLIVAERDARPTAKRQVWSHRVDRGAKGTCPGGSDSGEGPEMNPVGRRARLGGVARIGQVG